MTTSLRTDLVLDSAVLDTRTLALVSTMSRHGINRAGYSYSVPEAKEVVAEVEWIAAHPNAMVRWMALPLLAPWFGRLDATARDHVAAVWVERAVAEADELGAAWTPLIDRLVRHWGEVLEGGKALRERRLPRAIAGLRERAVRVATELQREVAAGRTDALAVVERLVPCESLAVWARTLERVAVDRAAIVRALAVRRDTGPALARNPTLDDALIDAIIPDICGGELTGAAEHFRDPLVGRAAGRAQGLDRAWLEGFAEATRQRVGEEWRYKAMKRALEDATLPSPLLEGLVSRFAEMSRSWISARDVAARALAHANLDREVALRLGREHTTVLAEAMRVARVAPEIVALAVELFGDNEEVAARLIRRADVSAAQVATLLVGRLNRLALREAVATRGDVLYSPEVYPLVADSQSAELLPALVRHAPTLEHLTVPLRRLLKRDADAAIVALEGRTTAVAVPRKLLMGVLTGGTHEQKTRVLRLLGTGGSTTETPHSRRGALLPASTEGSDEGATEAETASAA